MLVVGVVTVATAIRVTLVVVIGVTGLVTVDTVLFELVAATVDEKMNGNMENADLVRPALLLYSSWNCAPSSISSAKLWLASGPAVAFDASTCTYLCMDAYTIGVVSIYLQRFL